MKPTKTDLRKIAIAASWMPVMFEAIGEKERGTAGIDLIDKKITIDANRKSIDATKIYREVNHKNKMIAAFQRDGIIGVEAYLKNYESEIQSIIKNQGNVKQQIAAIEQFANGVGNPAGGTFSES